MVSDDAVAIAALPATLVTYLHHAAGMKRNSACERQSGGRSLPTQSHHYAKMPQVAAQDLRECHPHAMTTLRNVQVIPMCSEVFISDLTLLMLRLLSCKARKLKKI